MNFHLASQALHNDLNTLKQKLKSVSHYFHQFSSFVSQTQMQESNMMADKGATLDMSLFFGTPEEKKHFCTELLRLLKLRGGVKIRNHRIPDAVISELFDMVSLTSPGVCASILLTIHPEPKVLCTAFGD